MAEYIPQTDYEIKLSNFEGPLDLLLHLIKEAKVDIKDIFVSQITEQFLKYVTSMKELDMDKASEYMEMAATLLEIKSRMLLPKLEEIFDDEQDPETQLIRRLEEYKLFKEAGEKLKVVEDVNRFYKAPEPSAEDVRIVYTDFNLEAMLEAFTKLLIKANIKKRDKNRAKEIPKDEFTVADKIIFIKEQFVDRKEMSFFELFGDYYTRNEVITTFQAMLELLKLQFIKVKQNGIYDDINIVYNEERGEEFEEPSVEEFSEYN